MKKFRSPLYFASLIFLFISQPLLLPAQEKSKGLEYDPTYYEKFADKLTIRLLLSQKFVHFTIPSPGSADDINYRANTKLNLGVGFSYKGIGINVGYGFKFLNNDDEKGKTKGLNLQIHLYPRKFALDLLVLRPKGFWIHPKGYGSANQTDYYIRPDISIHGYGLSLYKVPNKKQFSYAAALSQTAWQKKSAGSLLFGGEAYYVKIDGDSPLVPPALSGFPQDEVEEITAYTVGVGFGGAYTLVAAQHFFIMGSLVANLDFTSVSEVADDVKTRKSGISPEANYKAAIGYNGPDWTIGANTTGQVFWFKGPSSAKSYMLPFSQVRLVFAKRFGGKK